MSGLVLPLLPNQYVFSYRDKALTRINQRGWRLARQRAGLEQVRVHDLKHIFGRCLRAAGVSFGDQQDLLGHKSGRITTHYSAAELSSLYEAANNVCQENASCPTLVVLKHEAASKSLSLSTTVNRSRKKRQDRCFCRPEGEL